jgi:hypothetical protein
MKNKHDKGAQPLQSENEVLDGQGERSAIDRPSWLGNALGIDKDTRASQARSMSSELFLQTRLFPLIERQVQVDRQTLVDLLVEFKRSRKDLDVGFEIANVMARILNRFQWYLVDDEESNLTLPSDALEREFDLFTALADLDFKNIDEEVQDRLHSG